MRPLIRLQMRHRISIRGSVHPFVCPSVHPCVRPSVHPSIRPPVCPSIRPSVRPSVRYACFKNIAIPLIEMLMAHRVAPAGFIFFFLVTQTAQNAEIHSFFLSRTSFIEHSASDWQKTNNILKNMSSQKYQKSYKLIQIS